MVGVNAQSQQQGLERDLHNPSGGESIAHLSVGHAYHVNTLRNTLEQGREGDAHVFL
jgi:hypothetical protein